MRSNVIKNNDIKRRDANQFLTFLNALHRKLRAKFIKTIASRYGVERHVVYSLCYTSSRIPKEAKSLIEDEAGRTILIETEDDTE